MCLSLYDKSCTTLHMGGGKAYLLQEIISELTNSLLPDLRIYVTFYVDFLADIMQKSNSK